MYTEKEFKEHVEVAKRILKDTYINNIIYVQERIKDGAKEGEITNIEDLIVANERMIVYFDEGDDWVKELHEEAKSKTIDGDDNGNTNALGRTTDDEVEFSRVEEARNS